MRSEMDRVLAQVDGGFRVLPAAAETEATADVLAVFGRKIGDVVAGTTGLNELATAGSYVLGLSMLVFVANVCGTSQPAGLCV